MFYIICNILYYIGMIVAAGVLLGVIAKAASAFEFEFFTRKQINKEATDYDKYLTIISH